MKKLVLFGILLSLLLLLTGCLSMSYNITLNKDGSGNCVLHVFVPITDPNNTEETGMARSLLEDGDDGPSFISGTNGIITITRDEIISNDNGAMSRYIEFAFSDISALNTDGIAFHRTDNRIIISNAQRPSSPEYPTNASAEEIEKIDSEYKSNLEMTHALFENQTLAVSITTPTPITEAYDAEIKNESTAYFEWPLADFFLDTTNVYYVTY